MPPKTENRVPINIWDDYPNDNSAIAGADQNTYAYVEDIKRFTKAEKDKIMKQLFDYIKKNVKLKGVKFSMKFVMNMERKEIYIQNLTHVNRLKLVEILRKTKLTHKGLPFDIYSES